MKRRQKSLSTGVESPCCSTMPTNSDVQNRENMINRVNHRFGRSDTPPSDSTTNSWSSSCRIPVIVTCLFALVASCAAIEMDRCADRSCYPATGNLLIGRERQLNATSTCGLHEAQRYCIVSYLEDEKKCFYCDSRRPYVPDYNENSHLIENIVTEHFDQRKTRWWQSENGVWNETVSIQLNLEAEFHFTHMIITFKSFRPAAMLIERSADYGRTWKVYRYFAHDCATTFPGIPLGPPKAHSDVVCTEQYSHLQPSTGGEVVLKVLAPHIPLENPYSEETQDLIRITNLRVNFTRMHTLGDNLLDPRPEILEKYNYAIYDMVVRGSCSCYGHAKHCVPIQGDGIQFVNQRPDMVHGRCECTHNTKGMNCEECMEFYNDLPWKPATENDTNECKRCNCNDHARRCHFDRHLFEASGFVSGGRCDECEHNTEGDHCEKCKTYFHRDHQREINDPYVCIPCRCDIRGAEKDGVCDPSTDEAQDWVSGRCHCKLNVDGDYCDRCKHGFWDLQQNNPDGCKKCSCYTQGTVNNEGCDKQTGVCTCKRFVTGEQCDQCLPDHYGLSSEPDGCSPCDCDLGGSFGAACDVSSGQCSCRPHFSGRRCDQPDSGYFCAGIDYYRYEAEQANMTMAEVERREMSGQQPKTWTGIGFARVRHGSMLIFYVNNVPYSTMYTPVIRHESRMPVPWQSVQLVFVRPDDPDPEGPCANSNPADDIRQTQIAPNARYTEAQPPVCLERGVNYEVRVTIGPYQVNGHQDPAAQLLIDSLILTPPIGDLEIFVNETALVQHHRAQYERYGCRHYALEMTPRDQMSEVCLRYICPIAAVTARQGLECKCDPTGSKSGICDIHGGQCGCKENVVGRRCNECAQGTFGFGPTGCTRCECDSVGSLHNFCDQSTGQCVCREKGVYGRQCDQCEPGFWGFPDCRPCQCNNHADICDQKTGACIECRDLTTGHNCDRCQDGYYGDPRLGVDIACRPCPCPGGPGSGKQHADTCYLNPATDSVACNCQPGYIGDRCDKCDVNYWGNPTELGGSCVRCDCNGNIDLSVPESCHAETGECLKCLHNTVGINCEHCAGGYFGDAKQRQCRMCVCNELGTNTTAGVCDRVSGQCPCLPNVVGVECDECAPNHWKLASREGCSACDCDPTGVRLDHNGEPMLQCNDFDGACACKPGRGGRKCDQCQDYFWGDPAEECKRCECNNYGSATQQCHRDNGTCECLPGSGGAHCDECARGYTGQWPHCQACGECFQNWDEILSDLKKETSKLVEQANNIEDTGVASVYDDDFTKMEETLGKVKKQLDTANVTKEDVDKLQMQIDELNDNVKKAKEKLNKVDARITNATTLVDQGEITLGDLKNQADEVIKKANELQENATKLREADVEGAYNITKESALQSQAAKRRTETADSFVAQSETKRREADELYDRNKEDFDQQYTENEEALEKLENDIDELEQKLPPLNEQVCGAPGAPCDPICGGPTCGVCGGPSCGKGAVTKAEQALELAKKAADMLETKQMKANKLLTETNEATIATEDAKREADTAYVAAKAAAQQANKTKSDLEKLLGRLKEFLERERASPDQIRTLAEEILAMNISLTPEEIAKLSDEIQENLGKLQNIDAILAETRGNLTLAQSLKDNADMAKKRAEAILNTTTGVLDALDKAKKAQEKARSAIDQAKSDIDTAQGDLETIETETKSAEQSVTDSNATLAELGDQLQTVRRAYVQIEQDVLNARKATEAATAKTDHATQKQDELNGLYDQAQFELKKKGAGDKTPKERAENLRKSAGQLLEQTQKHLRQIENEQQQVDSDTLHIENSERELDQLIARATAVQNAIELYERKSATCSCPEGHTDGCPFDVLL